MHRSFPVVIAVQDIHTIDQYGVSIRQRAILTRSIQVSVAHKQRPRRASAAHIGNYRVGSMSRPWAKGCRAPIQVKLIGAVRPGLCYVDEHPPPVVLPPERGVVGAEFVENDFMETPLQREHLAPVYLNSSIRRRLRHHVQRASPIEDERI